MPIEIAITNPGDYSGSVQPNTRITYPWGSPAKLSDPASLPTNSANSCAWSPNGEFLAVACSNGLVIYQRRNNVFTRISDPSWPGGVASTAAWSADGQFLAVTINGSNVLRIYQRSGTTFTVLSNPASSPSTGAYGCAWSPNGEFLAIGSFGSPYIYIYRRSGTTFTKLADPSPLPASTAYACAWSPDSQFLTLAYNSSPWMLTYQRTGLDTFATAPVTISSAPNGAGYGAAWSPSGEFLAVSGASQLALYQRSGTTLTKLTSPSLPSYGNECSWHPSGIYVAVVHGVSNPVVKIYQRSGTTFTLQADPATPPTGNGLGCAFSPDGQFLAVGTGSSPYVNIYQTVLTNPSNGDIVIRGIKRAGT